MRAVEQAEVHPGDGVAVFGCGPIGLSALAALVDRGHEKVVAVDLSPTRLELALGLGAQAALNPATTDVWDELARLHGTTPFAFGPTPATAAFIEASGTARVITDVLDHGPVGGRLSVVALHYQPIPTSYLMVLMKQFTIRGSMEYPNRFDDAIDLLADATCRRSSPTASRSSGSTTPWACCGARRSAARCWSASTPA